MVVYGLFHGLLFFPVVLSLIGPASFPMAHPVLEVALTEEELEPQLSHREKSEALGALKEEEMAIKISTEKECNL